MKTFLIVVAAVVVGLFLFLALAWLWLKRKISGFGEALAALAASPPPPFRITLEPVEAWDWEDSARVESASAELASLGYEVVGDFSIPEMDDLPVRGFAQTEWGFYAAVYEHPEAGVIADVVCSLTDGTHRTHSTAPESGLDQPPHSFIVRLPLQAGERGVVGQLHEGLRSGVADVERVPVFAGGFVDRFLQAYHREMDFRIARQGPTHEEIERIAELSGEEVDDQSVELVQATWRSAIEHFIDEEVRRAYLAQAAMTAAEWEETRDRLYIVHDHMDPESEIEILAWEMASSVPTGREDDQEEAQERAKQRLASLFSVQSLREAFGAAQTLLPDERQYEALGSVEEPWAADLYLMPPDECGDT